MSSFSLKSLLKAVIPLAMIPVFFSTSANAIPLTLKSTKIGGNDCAGYFKNQDPVYTGFSSCWVFAPDSERLISPVIAKFNEELSDTSDISERYKDIIDGDEWEFTGLSDSNKEGTWTYTPDQGDPSIRYWAAKAGNGFNLFWYVSDESACAGGAFTDSCMQAAVSVTTGTWSTPLNNGGNQAGLSHLTFYNSAQPPSGPPQEVPETGTIALMFLGMLGLVAGRRKYS
ncbi:PEP-CTERM sorting domain-containing protein [Thalassotalea litorea]|uniref:PEP-CTERM sorting domain-containing protein n=1 Tax=Thalassotalea litorea TaxID=2020715 RepID=UPI0037350904